MTIAAQNLDFQELNRQVKAAEENVVVTGCFGQRFIGTGLKAKAITIHGTPGNALGSYLDGGEITVFGNAQDAVGDTMNDGQIVIHGSAGDALGYAMRGGEIFVEGDAGYRTGIHMKEYEAKRPVIVVGGKVGSFLGEYLAGGLLLVLGLDTERLPIGNFPGTGMHGGQIFIRTKVEPQGLPKQVMVSQATDEDLASIRSFVVKFAELFSRDVAQIMDHPYYVLRPNATNPYKQLYVAN